MENPKSGLELRSLMSEDAKLTVSLLDIPVPTPAENEVVVKVQATPINPSDLGLLFGPADLTAVTADGAGAKATLSAPVPPQVMRAMTARLGQSMPVGNEGAGLVIAAGSSPEAQALLGKTVTMIGGGMYTQYRCLKASDCMALPEGASARDGASCFVNPLTALAFVETMRAEGHKAIIHTAAASNLGQMLVKICLADGVPLVNIVRSAEQAEILQGIGAKYVVDSTDPEFMTKLIAAVDETGATLAFDALGGGKIGGQIITAIEAAAGAKAGAYSRYGSTQFKQLYIYGGLDTGPTVLNRGGFGFSWSIGGFLLTPFLMKAGAETNARMRKRVMDELKTTFASHYSHVISLSDVLKPEIATAYNQKATGSKYLIDPSLG
ncbi:MAG: zinc-binding dehydrogenase [Pseudomonadota bacterium]|nr:zinc-binding dehydrogenase [Pseudomonadota bacterium]